MAGFAAVTETGAACATKSIIAMAALALVACRTEPEAQTAAPGAESAQQASAPVADSAPASDGLGDLDAMTLGCVKAGLNAAARQAADVPAQGTYQFSYFNIINASHHSAYEVRFKSNYEGEPELRYCVAIYCQQGWDPKTTQPQVTLMSNDRQRKGAAAHAASCGDTHAPAKRQVPR